MTIINQESVQTAAGMAAIIDHTFLKPNGSPDDITTLCQQALTYNFAVVMVHPSEITNCKPLLAGSNVAIGTVVGFPLGQNTSNTKQHETHDAITLGATEIDMVMNIRALQADHTALVKDDMVSVASLCIDADIISKVILETCYLSDQQKTTACLIARDAGISFVKTSTGLASGGATAHDITLMRDTVGPQMGVKAAGGIRSLDSALAMIRAGANRIGTSNGVSIIEEITRGPA